MQRLPDLPTDGYSTKRQRENTDAMMLFIRGVERNRSLLLSIVIDGLDAWVKRARSVWGSRVDSDGLSAMYDYFVLLVSPVLAPEYLHALKRPDLKRDLLPGIISEAMRQAQALAMEKKWSPYAR